MAFRTYIPQPPLLDFVEMFWLLEDHTQVAPERALPTATVELIIALRQNRLRVFGRQHPEHVQNFDGAMICGPHSEFFMIDAARDESVLGVHFKPGGAFPFLNLPLGELHNTHVALEMLWGATAVSLRERLMEAKTPRVKFHILEQHLRAQLFRAWAHHRDGRSRVVAFALQAFQQVPHLQTIEQVISKIGLSQRHFIQIFRRIIGVTPKQFCRVQRFQEVLRRLWKKQQVDWVDIALSCGYYDQAHFINDFKAFSGLNPTAYLTQRGERNPNHVPLVT